MSDFRLPGNAAHYATDQLDREVRLRKLLMIGVAISSLACGVARADTSTNDQVFANAALRQVHNLAAATAQSAQAAKDGDDLGCRDANTSIQEAAHEALKDMHYMSFTPIDAIENVSILLRLSRLTLPNECPYDLGIGARMTVAGQIVMSLRWDYAIGDGDWYTVNANGHIEAKNPLRYAKSLKDQNYSWVSVRPKGMLFMVESSWKAEIASYRVDDPSIQDSGDKLMAVDVDYRTNPNDQNSVVYFYRTRDDALSAAQAAKQKADDDAKADAEQKASGAEWSKKLISLPYMLASNVAGFKLIYAVCKPRKNAKGENTCENDVSHDWSDDQREPYHWFSDMHACESAQYDLNTKHPAGVKLNTDDLFVSDCVPASKVSGHILKGYQMVLALSAPGAALDDTSYASLRDNDSQTATIFKTFDACNGTIDATYAKLVKGLGIDDDGNILNDKTKSITLEANCVRVY